MLLVIDSERSAEIQTSADFEVWRERLSNDAPPWQMACIHSTSDNRLFFAYAGGECCLAFFNSANLFFTALSNEQWTETAEVAYFGQRYAIQLMHFVDSAAATDAIRTFLADDKRPDTITWERATQMHHPWCSLPERHHSLYEPRPVRRRNRKSKVAALTPVSEDLRHAMQEAVELLQESDRDEDILFSDDCIQIGDLRGGPIDSNHHHFVFDYCSETHGGFQWKLKLKRVQIEDIADAVLDKLPMWRCRSSGCKRLFPEPTSECPNCDYDSE